MTSTFNTGLFDCTKDVNQCVDTACCAPCAASRQLMAIEGNTDTLSVPHCVAASCFGVCVNIMIRMKVVEKYQIEEGMPITVCTVCICGGCSLCQTHRELSSRNSWPGGMVCHKQPTSYDELK